MAKGKSTASGLSWLRARYLSAPPIQNKSSLTLSECLLYPSTVLEVTLHMD